MRATALFALAFVLGCGGGSDPDSGTPPGVDSGAPTDAPRPDVPTPDVDAYTPPTGCMLPEAWDVGATYERTLYVATTGSSSGDGSAASPFGSIEEAARAATAGTRIVMRAGTYTGSWYIENLAGEPTRPIAIVGEGDVILDADGAGEVLHVTEATYLVIENITFQNSSINGLNIDDGGTSDTPTHHVVLRDLVVRDVGTGGNNDCIKLSGVDDFFVLGSLVQRCDAGDGIDQVGCHRGFMRGNRFESLSGGGIQMKGGSSDSLVHGNVFVDVAGRSINAGGSTGLEFFRPIDAPYEAARLTIAANVFVRPGASFGAPIAFVGCDGCVFANNTIVDPQRWVARILQESTDARFVPSRNGLFVDNIVVFDTGTVAAIVNVGGGTAPDTFTFGSNLWLATDDPGFSGPNIDPSIPPETGSVIQMDPMFADAASGDHHVPPSSPAVGAGRVVAGVTADFDGRCWASPPSIGAFEGAP
jgi:hypothetical protein